MQASATLRKRRITRNKIQDDELSDDLPRDAAFFCRSR
jgi:hypothetical protein